MFNVAAVVDILVVSSTLNTFFLTCSRPFTDQIHYEAFDRSTTIQVPYFESLPNASPVLVENK